MASDLRFTTESLDLRDEIEQKVNEKLRALLVDRAKRQEGDVVITKEDVLACIKEAWAFVFREMGLESEHAGC